MTTWCILSSMFRRFKCSKRGLEMSLRACVQAQKMQAGAQLDLCARGMMGCINTRLLHIGHQDLSKRLPPGVQQKRKPLKMTKGISLSRVHVHNGMTIEMLAAAMNKSMDHVYEVLFHIPKTECYDHDEAVLDQQTIIDVVKKSGMIPEFVSKKEEEEEKNEDVVRQPPPDPSVLVRRPPVVTIMGHVDHGKTTLLDKLRNSNVVDSEFGGITQHTGAFLVTLQSGESICFLDTPGHAAFSAMRARGADLTDIIILVVAADDGVMPQTIESIRHAESAGVPIIVAINKIDKQNANVERTKQMLLEHQIQLEEFGGDVQAVPISALKGVNLAELQEAIVTQAELMNLKGDPVGLVEGRVVDARLDEKRGRLAMAVIQRGTLRKGQYLIAGTAWAKVRAMFDDRGNPVQQVQPGMPVEILGWKETPSAGDEILQVKEEAELKRAVAWRLAQQMKVKQEQDAAVINELRSEHDKEYTAALVTRRQQGFYRARQTGPRRKEITHEDEPQFSLVIKGDVDGTVDALLDVLDTYKSRMCRLDLIHFGVGHVTESDVEIAADFNGEVYAFNVQVPEKVAALAKSKQVPIKKHNIIYRLFEDLIASINKRLPKIKEDVIKGEAKVLQVFQVTLPNKKKSYVAGCRCTFGSMSKKLKVKVMRDGEVVCEGSVVSLKHFKNEVDSVKKEEEFGISLSDQDFVFQPQDMIVSYEVKDVDQEIDWNPGFVGKSSVRD
ncbi:unnamed protein product [Candidula unifasciata]|uniref:Tr-type G domain-containing protein n=1 Tax=Candidula unifasciata TaxID=100452 RepID=A0A8S3Z3S4_9EUPU|nr:unnamed protein product [Candidula unifasciata]